MAFLLLLRLVLAAVFLLAGTAKLIDRRGSVQALRNFGVAGPAAPIIGWSLPLVETVIAIALIPLETAWWGALGSLLLLLGFIAGIAYNLARGKTPDCHCFGQLYSRPVGRTTLVRNGLLAVAAGIVVVAGRNDPGASAVAWMGHLSVIEGVLLGVEAIASALVGIGAWAILQLLRQNGRVLLRLEAMEAATSTGSPVAPVAQNGVRPVDGLPVGSMAPNFDLFDVHGNKTSLSMLASAGKPVLLLFSSLSCEPCNTLLPEIGEWQRQHGQELTIALVSQGDAAANRAKMQKHGIRTVLVQDQREMAQVFMANATPSGVIVRPDGRIGSPLAVGPDAVRSLVAFTVGAEGSARVLLPSDSQPSRRAQDVTERIRDLPDLPVSTLDGDVVSARSLAGEPTALLFWNPGCGFCNRMLEDLKEAETKQSDGVPRIILISTGETEQNRAMGLQSTILLDQGFSVGRAYGATGTPSAVLVGTDGVSISSVVVGAPAVLALISEPVKTVE